MFTAVSVFMIDNLSFKEFIYSASRVLCFSSKKISVADEAEFVMVSHNKQSVRERAN